MAQASGIGKRLQKFLPKIDVVFSSPYLRTMRTRDLLIEECSALGHARQITDARLTEKRTGEVKKDYISYFILNPAEFLKVRAIGREFYYDYQPPGGESSQQVITRVKPFVNDLYSRYKGQNMFIIAHKVSIFALIATLEGKTSREHYLQLDTPQNQIANGGLTSYCWQNDGQLHRAKFNQT